MSTIAGIASGMGGGIGIIRVSGPDSFQVVSRIFNTKDNLRKNLVLDSDYFEKKDSHTIHFGYIVDGDVVVDEVIVLVMKAPKSYTKEDVIEIDSHGGSFVLHKILHLLLKKGARLSEPGEFTKRAFLNGRIDLSQAEAVMKMISSKNEFALDTAVKQLEGNLSNYISDIREKLLFQMGFMEAALDDPEHYSLDGYDNTLKGVVEEQLKRIDYLLDRFDDGRIRSEGINTVIVGKPNAGKSSLMNLLLDEERAIVTHIAGTTRDILEETFRLGDLILNLVDTAGIRQTNDVVESIGVKRAMDSLEQADFVIYVIDVLDSFDEEDEKIISLLNRKKGVILLNKSDVKFGDDLLEEYTFDSERFMNEEFSDFSKNILKTLNWKTIVFSAKDGFGLNELERYIKDLFMNGDISYNDQIYLTSLRHKEAVADAGISLRRVLDAIDDGMPEDILMVDMMDAYQSLGLINGDTASEDLVNKIFEEFCMGK